MSAMEVAREEDEGGGAASRLDKYLDVVLPASSMRLGRESCFKRSRSIQKTLSLRCGRSS
eukprot:870557-Amphidinium_carterae.1